MRYLLHLTGFLLLFTFIASCGKNDDAILGGTVAFKIDNTTDFKTTTSTGMYEKTNNLLTITAQSGNALIVMSAIIPNDMTVGSYDFTMASGLTTAYFKPDITNANEVYYSNIDRKTFGTLVISDITTDKLVTGSFEFTLKDPITAKTKTLTNGNFTKLKIGISENSITSTILTAKVDGVVFTSKQLTGAKVPLYGIQLTGSDGTKMIRLTIIETAKAGTYSMGSGSDCNAQYNPTISAPNMYNAEAATSKLIISEHNRATKRIKGTFTFKGVETGGIATKQITEGVFDVLY